MIIKAKNINKKFKQYKKKEGLRGSVTSFFKREYFDIVAVKNVSFEIEEGEFVGFIGPNGAGKTTTLKILSGILFPSSGELEVLGYKPFLRQPEFQKQFAIVMGGRSQLWWELPPLETFLLNKEIYLVSDTNFNNTLDELSDILDIKEILNIPVRKLSLGQRMKCELVASIIHRPKLLFLDEPTLGLDVVMQKRIRNFLKHYNKDSKTTIILTSHYMDDVAELCNRIMIINHGTKVYDGSLKQLLNDNINKKFLKLTFIDTVDIKDLEHFGEIIEADRDGYTYTISVDRKDHAKIAGEILIKFKIDDLDITEPSLEDIISNIYQDKN